MKVVISFPLAYSDADLEGLINTAVDIAITVCPYEEPGGVRSARTRGDFTRGPHDREVSAEYRAAMADADVLMALDVPTALTSIAPRLRWIQCIGAGVGYLTTVDLPPDVVVTNASGLGAPSIAEWVLGRILAYWKQFDQAAIWQGRHTWQPEAARGRTLRGCTIAVVGIGAIGTAVAERARAFGMRVIGVRRGETDHPLADRTVPAGQLYEVLPQADAVVVCAPATADTTRMFSVQAFAAMKKGACNVARGTLVDEDALIGALRSGHLGMAVLDVTRAEPLPPDSPLWDTTGLVVSPHVSTALDRYKDDLLALFAENLKRWVDRRELLNVVDLHGRGY